MTASYNAKYRYTYLLEGLDNTARTLIYQKRPIDAVGHYGYQNCICNSQKKILSRLRSNMVELVVPPQQ